VAGNDETPEIDQPTTVDTPRVRPPAPRESDERYLPEMQGPEPAEPEVKPPHVPRHAAAEVTRSARRERLAQLTARPGGRFLLPGGLLAVMLAAAGVAGAVVVRQ